MTKMGYKLVKRDDRYDLYDESTGQKIASNLMQGNGLKLSTKNCEAISNGYDLDAIVNKIDTPEGYDQYQYDSGIRKGFELALEILGDKKFCEEDVILISEYVRVASQSTPNVRTKDLFDEHQSLQQTEWDVIIQLDDVLSFEANQNNARFNPNFGEYLLDSEGCLILKRK